ncbi:MAG: Gfo/Idh/MocA family oxidoreductase [Planctomycetes bacterium]|nr:Gfo/Idh/MocA family oxidoreductase [Planctomycetota bacterium]
MMPARNRREFLKSTAAIGVGAWIAGPDLAAAAQRSANEQINIACIGVGGKGSSDTDHAGNHGNIVALCDIDDNHLGAKAAKFPQARKFNDFRKMFDDLSKQIDAVTVSTPDHTHAAASMQAIKLGKHVYTQKPLTFSVYEARALREEAKKRGVCTQMGTQGGSLDGFRSAVEVLRAGAIGAVREVHVWTDRCGRFWKQAPDVVARPIDKPAVPAHVHWNEFLGPAPERPYSPLYHPFAWRGWRDFGTGALGDMACHLANMPFYALNLGYPSSITAENSAVNPETFQQWATIRYEFPARGNLAPVSLVWWEGIRNGQRNLPPADLFLGQPQPENGILCIGEKGTLFTTHAQGGDYKLLPGDKFEGFKAPEKTLPRLGSTDANSDDSQKKEWIAACKAGKPDAALCNFEHAGLLTEAVLLGNVAILAGKKIEWDGAAMKVTNLPAANQYLHREYRKGWTL